MPSILLTNYYSQEILTVVAEELPSSFSMLTLERNSRNELIEKAAEADYFLIGGRIKIDKEVIDSAPRLKMAQRSGVGMDTVDVEAFRKRNIPIYVNFGVNARSVAEHTIMLMLSTLRRLCIVNSTLKQGVWKKHELGIRNYDLAGKSVGLVGLGKIGTLVAQMLRPFGVRILYFKPQQAAPEIEEALQISFRSLPELLMESDIVSLHCPLNNSTEKIIGKRELAMTKPGAVFINTSRGQLVDESALVDSLQSGHLGGAGLDVFSNEPLPSESPIYKLDNIIVTPHIGGITYDSFRKMMRDAFFNIKYYHEGRHDLINGNKL